MRTSTPDPSAPGAAPLDAIEVPSSPAVLRRILPAVARALDGGPALLPLPAGPAPLRESLLATFRPREPLDADGVALVVPTSGSTAQPKGVLLGAEALRASATATLERLGGPGRWLLALPATHIAGLMVLVRSVVAETEPVAVDLTDGFDPELFAAAAVRLVAGSEGPRYTALVPRQLSVLLDTGGPGLHALTMFDAVLVGGSATADALLDRAREAGVRIVTTYGMTETSGGCVYDGVPLDNVRVQVADDGRIRISGPTLALGYRLDPDATRAVFADGWFSTADIGRFEADHRLSVAGRLDDVAVSGGVNVPLAAVDAAVASHPGVAEVLCVAVPDDDWGQRIVAAVVARDPDHPPRLESVRAHVGRQASAAYAPKELVVVDALPVLPGGKTDRRGLAARLHAAAPAC